MADGIERLNHLCFENMTKKQLLTFINPLHTPRKWTVGMSNALRCSVGMIHTEKIQSDAINQIILKMKCFHTFNSRDRKDRTVFACLSCISMRHLSTTISWIPTLFNQEFSKFLKNIYRHSIPQSHVLSYNSHIYMNILLIRSCIFKNSPYKHQHLHRLSPF